MVTESLSSLTSLDRSEDSDEDDLDRASLEDFSEDEDIKMIIRYRSSKRYIKEQDDWSLYSTYSYFSSQSITQNF